MVMFRRGEGGRRVEIRVIEIVEFRVFIEKDFWEIFVFSI